MRRPEVGLFALAMLASACAIPTESPNWDMTWNVPVNIEGLGIDITKIALPTGITIDSTGTNPAIRTGFSVGVSAIPAISRTLGAQCPTCPNATAPKPAFTAPVSTTTISLESGSALNSATLATGSQIVITLNNGFGFDPINPPGGNPGTITLAVNNGSATIGTLTLVGPTTTIPSGATRNFTIPLTGTINTASPITVTMTMDSPAGSPTQPVTMSSGQIFTATSAATIKVASATVSLAANPINPDPSGIDGLADLGDMAKRIANTTTNEGAMILTITNPISIAANATLVFTGTRPIDEEGTTLEPIVPISKTLAIPAGGGATSVSTVTVNFTGQELRRMLGATLVATMGGSTVAGTATAVTPNHAITMTSRMRIRLFVKEIE